MCSGAAFIIGIALLIRGRFTFNDRAVPPEKTRIIAFVLMLPLLVGFCAGLFVLPSMTGTLDLETLQTAAFIEFLAFVAAIVGVAYLIASVPPGTSSGDQPAKDEEAKRFEPFQPFQPQMPQPPPVLDALPKVLSVEQAAAYLRRTPAEVLALIEQGKLPAARDSSGYQIARIALEDYLSEQQNSGQSNSS
ncbi:MAG: helix-turn-helix domain-containing protein [Aggregatilineales bacterium]